LNYKLLSFDHTKDMILKMELPLVDLNFIATLTGRPLEVGSVNVPTREVKTVSAGNTISLAATPVSDLKIYTISGRDVILEQTLGNPATTQNTYSISGATVTFNSSSTGSGTQVVATYKYATPATTRKTTFSADRFAPYLRVVGSGIVSDQVDGNEYVTKFEILKCKPQNNFTITMMSTDATKLDITMDLYAVDVTQNDGSVVKTYVNFFELV